MMTKEVLYGAVRQYRHNNNDSFVFGYDKNEVDRIVTSLFGQIKKLEKEKEDNDREGCERCKIQTAIECATLDNLVEDNDE